MWKCVSDCQIYASCVMCIQTKGRMAQKHVCTILCWWHSISINSFLFDIFYFRSTHIYLVQSLFVHLVQQNRGKYSQSTLTFLATLHKEGEYSYKNLYLSGITFLPKTQFFEYNENRKKLVLCFCTPRVLHMNICSWYCTVTGISSLPDSSSSHIQHSLQNVCKFHGNWFYYRQ